MLQDLGLTLYAMQGTAEFLRANGIDSTVLHWPLENQNSNVMDYLAQKRIDETVGAR